MESSHRTPIGKPRLTVLTAAAVSIFAFRMLHVTFLNDHFDRISRGQQILQWNAVPFRDFFDPGYFLALYSSATVQALFGHNLLGEALLTVTFIAIGSTLTLLLAQRLSGSWPLATILTAAAVATMPRLYSYDKVLFLPLGVLLCWRYVDKPTLRRLAVLGGATGLAAMYRYDSGLYIACAAVTAVLATHGCDLRTSLRRLTGYAAVGAATLMPALLFIHTTAGVPEAARQVAEYARREGRRTAVFTLPAFEIDTSAPFFDVFGTVNVRWREGVTDDDRAELERRFALRLGEFQGGRTWQYRLKDLSRSNVTALIGNNEVEDTHGLDRNLESDRLIAQEVEILPGVLTPDNAVVWLASVFMAIPIVSLLGVLVARGRADTPFVLSAAALSLSANLFLLRDPLSARIGDVAAPAVPLAAWCLSRAIAAAAGNKWRLMTVRTITTIGLVTTGLGVVILTGPETLIRTDWERMVRLRDSPPSAPAVPGWHQTLANYLRACTGPQDRVFVNWFMPDVYYLAGRGFAGGMPVLFGGHWSRPRDQQTIVARLRAESVPLALLEARSYADFQTTFSTIDRYLGTSYSVAGESSFGDSGRTYRVLVRMGAVSSTDPTYPGLPCFR